MLRYAARRILLFIPTLVLVSILSFFLSRVAQSDPVEKLLELEGLTPDVETYEAAHARRYVKEGYDKPLFYWSVAPSSDRSVRRNTIHYPKLQINGLDNQYHRWVSNVLSGDFGTSTVDGRKASDKILSALKWTFLFLVLNVLFTVLIAVPYGLYTGLHAGRIFDRWSGNFLFAVFSMPSFWLATVLILFFASSEYGLKIFPSVGMWYSGGGQSFLEMLSSKWSMLILPLCIVVLKDVAYLGRMIRDTVLKIARQQYATTAKAKGVSGKRYALRHILPNALGPAITLVAGAIPTALGGSLLMEVIFNIPGMGRLMYTSIYSSDWSVVFSIILMVALVTSVWYLIGDMLSRWLNPRLRDA